MDYPFTAQKSIQRTPSTKHPFWKSNGFCCLIVILLNICVLLLVCGLYVLLCLQDTRAELSSLKLEFNLLRAKFENLQSRVLVDQRQRRSVRTYVRQRVDGLGLSGNSTGLRTGNWQNPWMGPVRAIDAESSTTSTISSTSAVFNPVHIELGPSGELPVTAYESSNLVRGPESQESFGFNEEENQPLEPPQTTVSFAADLKFVQEPDSASDVSSRSHSIISKSRISDSRSRSGQTTSGGGSSSFVRWGKVNCPQVATLAYAGYAAAANPWYGMGGSTELECLSTSPSWYNNSPTAIETSSKLFAAKLDLGLHTEIFDSAAHQSVLTCAVCVTNKSPVITIPGRVDCLSGWHREYNGYMMTTSGVRYEMYFSSRNYCVDMSPDYYTGHEDSNGLKLTFLQAGNCYNNRSPCHSYIENNLMPCTVCSKYSD
ncbi:uncharacterized protein [Watersipora subatra]|uniref:uncharacterized protein n=1 Tax=Watersipora subatra TaxID=2589382 RepID=UPI00355AD3D6